MEERKGNLSIAMNKKQVEERKPCGDRDRDVQPRILERDQKSDNIQFSPTIRNDFQFVFIIWSGNAESLKERRDQKEMFYSHDLDSVSSWWTLTLEIQHPKP